MKNDNKESDFRYSFSRRSLFSRSLLRKKRKQNRYTFRGRSNHRVRSNHSQIPMIWKQMPRTGGEFGYKSFYPINIYLSLHKKFVDLITICENIWNELKDRYIFNYICYSRLFSNLHRKKIGIRLHSHD